ncbi:MAG: YeeE/YedE thiosulfate transporter family protein [Methanospirillum sp.]
MLDLLFAPRWSPYLAGAGIGLLMILAFLLSNRPIGCSTAYLKARGMLGQLVAPERTGAMEYYRRFAPTIDWQFMIVPGVVIGAFLAAWLSGTFGIELVPQFWVARFGGNIPLRWAVGLAGGILLGFGSRWAGGCTSGHGIGGNIQLSIASLLASAGFFVGGILISLALFGVPWGQGVWGIVGGGP